MITLSKQKIIILSILLLIVVCLLVAKVSINSSSPEEKSTTKATTEAILKHLDENPAIVTQWMVKHSKAMSDALKTIEELNSNKKYQEFQQYIYLGEFYDVNKPIVFEFYNFGCTVCKDAFRTLKSIPELKPYNVALLHIHSDKYPYASLLAQVVEALAVLDKRKVIPFIEAVFDVQPQFETEEFNLVLTQVWRKIDVSEPEVQKIWETIKEQKLYDKLVLYRNLADENDINSTPSFVIKGSVYKGMPPIEIFKNILTHKN